MVFLLPLMGRIIAADAHLQARHERQECQKREAVAQEFRLREDPRSGEHATKFRDTTF
jgi:hypothetical protein